MVMLVFLKQSNFNHVTINEIIAALEPINQRPLKTIGLIRINFTICLESIFCYRKCYIFLTLGNVQNYRLTDGL
jgi:hypothetical protein